MRSVLFVLLAALCALSFATVFFEDDLSKPDWESRWVVSNWKQSDGTAGKWELSAGKHHGANAKSGLRTSEDARFYAISSKLPEPLSNKGKTLVVQFSVKHEQNIDCGGGYIKLLADGVDQKNFDGDSKYAIMFGPDICGAAHKIVHFILHKNGENKLIKRNVAAESDEFTHVYTAVLKPDNTYEIYVDGEKKQDGALEDDWELLPPKKINDPAQSKPADWVDDPMMDDPEDKKPEGWDDIPAEITDPEATKPEDWDDDLDGEWEAPKVPNPDYKGPWRAKRIANPDYKGPWEHPQIDNPEYKEDATLYELDTLGALGIEIWQVKSGSIFSNFLVTDDLSAALSKAEEVNKAREEEVAAKKAADEAKAAAEAAAKAEEDAKAAEAETAEVTEEKTEATDDHEDL